MTEQLPLKALISLFAFAKLRCHFWVVLSVKHNISNLVTHGAAMATGLPAKARWETCQLSGIIWEGSRLIFFFI
jgi:hypothetical protein